MNLTGLSINWFDGFVAVILGIGLLRGRKRGMSEELLDLVQMALMVVTAGVLYLPWSNFLNQFTGFPLLVTHIGAYVSILIGIKLIFMLVKRATGEKLLGSDSFGRFEYYLGMLSGIVRWAGGLIIALSLLNARLIPDAEYEAKLKADKELYGDNYFTIFSLGYYQRAAFKESYVGPHIEEHLGRFLIQPTPIGDIMQQREGFGRKKEREMEELMKGNKR